MAIWAYPIFRHTHMLRASKRGNAPVLIVVWVQPSTVQPPDPAWSWSTSGEVLKHPILSTPGLDPIRHCTIYRKLLLVGFNPTKICQVQTNSVYHHLLQKNIIWSFNIENPNHKWRFLAGKIIYKCAISHGYVSHNQRTFSFNGDVSRLASASLIGLNGEAFPDLGEPLSAVNIPERIR